MQSMSHFDLLRNEHLELQSKYADLKSKYELLAADKVFIIYLSSLLFFVINLFYLVNCFKLNSMINQADEKNITPLELALTLSHTNIALQLMQHNADCNVKDEMGQSILARMVLMGNVFASGFLVSNGADLRFVHNSTGKGLLHYLAESTENKKIMADWVESCLPLIDVNAKDKQGRTALILSILLNNIYLTEVLLRYGVDVIAEDDMQNTALSVALFLKNDLILAEKLTQLGGTVAVNHSINGEVIETLLHMSLQLDKDDVLRFLIENKVSINETNKQGCTPLHCAVQQNNVQAVNHLLNAGASSNQIDNQGNSPLHLAIMKGRYMTELFAKSATDVDWCLADRNGRSALRLALEGHFLDSAHVLISAGSPVDEEDQRGNSLLVQCLLLGDDEGAVFLLDRGAQHWKKDSSGRSCLELAASHGLPSSVRALCGNGINLNKRTDGGKGYTVLEKAISEGITSSFSFNIVFYLIHMYSLIIYSW
uniref:ANK_REP_REGION domain-containing protein n=1 Tax=Heterorhabditis bacteriophora TaxID=37862 RepID=A0A1I7W7J8_HETBA